MEVSTLKLILKGANTNDENTLESYGVKEGDFLVVMQTKVSASLSFLKLFKNFSRNWTHKRRLNHNNRIPIQSQANPSHYKLNRRPLFKFSLILEWFFFFFRKPNPTTGQSQPGQPADNNSNVVQDFSQASASNVVLGDKFNQTVEEICKMGFPKEDTIKALKAAFNNPDRAIDYLINVRTYRKNLS